MNGFDPDDRYALNAIVKRNRERLQNAAREIETHKMLVELRKAVEGADPAPPVQSEQTPVPAGSV